MFATSRGLLILQLLFLSSLVSSYSTSTGVFHHWVTSGIGHHHGVTSGMGHHHGVTSGMRHHHGVTSGMRHRHGEKGGKRRHHDKRVNKDINGFSKEQIAAILEKHNHLRAQIQASNMLKLTWDPELASFAQNYSAQCNFKHHSNRRNVAGFQYVGENLYVGTSEFAPEAIVQHWYDEVKDYNHSSGSCTPKKVCGHYTQIVWADTRAVGCGVKYCEPFTEDIFEMGVSKGYLVVCNYGPAGNWVGKKPYEAGTPCSKCPAGTTCSQGLCA